MQADIVRLSPYLVIHLMVHPIHTRYKGDYSRRSGRPRAERPRTPRTRRAVGHTRHRRGWG